MVINYLREVMGNVINYFFKKCVMGRVMVMKNLQCNDNVKIVSPISVAYVSKFRSQHVSVESSSLLHHSIYL